MADSDLRHSGLRERRARSFGRMATEYARHRPGYPADGVRWAFAAADGDVRRVLDLAAGTGKLTGVLLGLGVEVTAVEPDQDMRAELSARLPEVPVLTGSAENIPLPDASVDAVVVGQAFHWFDRTAALSEIARVLRPGGALGELSNHDDVSVAWVAELNQLSRSSVSLQRGLDHPDLDHESFTAAERATFAHALRRTADSLVATIGTHSHTLVIPEHERAELLARARDYLRSRTETATGEFDMPLVTAVSRTRRR